MGTGALTGIFLYRAYGGRASDACDDSYIKMLTGAGCLVIAMDSRGHGRSVLKAAALKTAALKITVGKKGKLQNSSDKRHTAAADMAEDVVRLLDHLKIEKAVILGFSDGANTALEFAADHPERAEKIIAVSANALPGRSDPSYAVYGEYPFPVCEDLREYKASGKIWKMV